LNLSLVYLLIVTSVHQIQEKLISLNFVNKTKSNHYIHLLAKHV